jgi:hypothetical protein
MNDDPISKALDLTPLTQLDSKAEIVPFIDQSPQQEQINSDFEYARGNLIAVIEKGQEALTGIVDVAGMSQHPRSFEVVATLINAVTSANKDLLELQKRKKDLLKLEDNKGPTTQNNNLFVGSTAELLKMIKAKNNGV